MTTSSTALRQVLVCRTLSDAQRGGVLEEVAVAALKEAIQDLRRIDQGGAEKIADPASPDEPLCLLEMPRSCRLLLVRHRNEHVGIVVPTYAGGGEAQRDGIISQASGNPGDRSNFASFFRR